MWTSIVRPTARQLFSFTQKENSPYEKKLRKNSRNHLFWASRSLQSIELICLWFKEEFKRSPVILLPSYICYEVPQVFLANGAEVLYYDIDENFSVDMNSVQLTSNKVTADFFLAIHLFGIVSDLTNVKKWCFRNKITLIEDSTHVPFPLGSIGTFGEICLYSPYKHFPVPDGAAAVIKESYLVQFPKLRKRFEKLSSTPTLPILWCFKKLIQTLFRIQKANPLISHSDDPGLSPLKIRTHGASEYSINILSHYTEEELDEIVAIRKQNTDNWNRTLYMLGFENSNMNSSPLPMSFVFKSEKSKAQALFEMLNNIGVYPSTWPTLPTNLPTTSSACNLRQSITLMPVHQGINAEDFLKIVKIAESNLKFNLAADIFTGHENEWEALFDKVHAPNILHSNAYIRSRLEDESENIQRYIIKKENGEFQGMTSIRIKKFGPLRIHFINRGPLMISDDLLLHVKAIHAIRKEIKLRELSILVIAPEIDNSPITKKYLNENLMIRIPFSYHHSSRINLRLPISMIRNNLDSKWRNLLKKGEALSLNVSISQDLTDYKKLLELYKEFVQEKDFKGLSLNLLENYYKNNEVNHKPLVLCLYQDSKIISSVLVAFYSDEALYLIGINDDEGRKACGNYILLWKAIEHVSSLGFKRFDLGGFDEIGTPKITHFKRQMGGDEYKLVGTYLILK